jgi:hypothetical protein
MAGGEEPNGGILFSRQHAARYQHMAMGRLSHSPAGSPREESQVQASLEAGLECSSDPTVAGLAGVLSVGLVGQAP